MNGEERTVSVYADESERVHCMKCLKLLHEKDIAMLVRTTPTDGFNAWCAACTRWLMVRAAAGLDVNDYEAVIVAF